MSNVFPVVLRGGEKPPYVPSKIGVSDLPVFRQAFHADASGTAGIAAQAGFVLRPIGLRVIGGANATTCALTSATTNAVLSETIYLGAVGGGIQIEKDREGIMLDAPAGEGITITAGAGNEINGFISYLRIPINRFSLDNAGGIVGWNDGSPYVQ
jgi:hypothetical protein